MRMFRTSIIYSIFLLLIMVASVTYTVTSVIIVHALTDYKLSLESPSLSHVVTAKDLGREMIYDVYLITGDRVLVTYVNGKYLIRVKPANVHRSFIVLHKGNDIYVVPTDVNLEKFDLDLFNIRVINEIERFSVGHLPIIVKVRSDVMLDEFISKLTSKRELKSIRIKPLRIIHSVVLRVPYESLPYTYKELSTSKEIVKVVPDRIVRILSNRYVAPTLYRSIHMIGAPNLWSLGYNGSGIKIAILDTGIDANHPDFFVNGESKILVNVSFIDYDFDGKPDEPPVDYHGHGTHCAGIATGTGGYLDLIKGVAPGAKLLIGKVLASNVGIGFWDWIIAGIEWAANSGADVISMSLGGSAIRSWDPVVDAVKKAVEKGVIVVIAAGNEGPSYFTIDSPGVTPEAITVGAMDKEFRMAYFSSVGPTPNATLKPDVVAPGVDIASARANGTYMGDPASLYHVYASGTSMATPHVAGYVALILQYMNSTGLLKKIKQIYNVSTPLLIKDVIVSTASELGYEPLVEGAGMINATNFVYLVNQSKLVVIHPARNDVVGYEGVVSTTLIVINPFDSELNLTLDTKFIAWGGLVSQAIPQDAIVVNTTTLKLQPFSKAGVKVTINLTKLPIGYHALKIYFKDDDGDLVGKALMGISRPARLLVSASFNGTPVELIASITAFSPIFGLTTVSGFIDWGWTAAGVDQVELYPLYPDALYLLSIDAILPSDSNEGIYRYGTYYTILKIDSSKTEYSFSIDFAKLTPVSLTTYKGLSGLAVAGYGVIFKIVNISKGSVVTLTTEESLIDTYLPTSEYKLEVYLDLNRTPVSEWGYEASLDLSYFNVKGELQPSLIYPDPSKPILVYYRVFDEIPKGSTIILNPRKPSVFLIHAHSAISDVDLTSDCSSMGVLSDEAPLDIARCFAALVPSITYYLVDSNVPVYGAASDDVNVSATSSYGIIVSGTDFTGIRLSDNIYLYAPLKMPKGATLWSLSYVTEGLDKRNITFVVTYGHLFRQSIWGTYYVTAYPNVPYFPQFSFSPFYGAIIIDGKVIMESPSFTTIIPPPIIYYLLGFNETSAPVNASVYYEGLLTYPDILLKFHPYAHLKADMIFVKPNYTAMETITGFGYGVGVRDIMAYGGYDYLLNYVENESVVYLHMVFNTPIIFYPYDFFDLNKSTVKIYLLGPKGAQIELPIVDWYTLSPIPLPVAVVKINSTEVLMNDVAGPYDLKVTGRYYDVTNETKNYIDFELYVEDDIYIGKPPFTPAGGVPIGKPLIITVGPPDSGADFTSLSEALSHIRPGGLILINGTITEDSTIVIDKEVTIVGLNDVGITLKRKSVAFEIKAPATIAFINISNATTAFKLVNTSLVYIEGVNAEASKFLEVEAPYESHYWKHVIHRASINATPVAYLVDGGIIKGSYSEVHLVFGDYTVSDAEISSLESINTTVSIHDSKIATLYAVGSSITSYDSVIKSWSGIESTYTGYGKVIVRVLFNGKPVSNAKVKISNSLGSDTASTESDGKATLLGIYAKCVNSVCTYDYSATVTASKKGLKASKTVSLQTTPLTVDVSLPVPTLTIEVKDIFGNVVSELSPGTILSIKSTYDLLTFNGKATVKIVLYKDGVSIASTAIYPSQRKGSVILGVMIPYEDGTYTVKVYLILEGLPSISKSWP